MKRNYIVGLIGLFCTKHKRESDVYLAGNHCQHEGCNIQAFYGSLSNDISLWCSKHKQPEDVYLSEVRCEVEGCDGPRSFGSREDGVASRCRVHKCETDENSTYLRAHMHEALGLGKK